MFGDVAILDHIIVIVGFVWYVRQSHPVVRRPSSTKLGLSLLFAVRLAALRMSSVMTIRT